MMEVHEVVGLGILGLGALSTLGTAGIYYLLDWPASYVTLIFVLLGVLLAIVGGTIITQSLVFMIVVTASGVLCATIVTYQAFYTKGIFR